MRDADGATLGSDDELRRLFYMLDSDNSGSLDFRELLVGLAVINDHGVRKLDDTLALAFKILDRRGAGRVTKPELTAALRRVWPDLTADTADAIFAEADRNRDGTVSAAEFVTWARAHQEHIPLFKKAFLGFETEGALLSPPGRTPAAAAGGSGDRGAGARG